MKRVRLRHPVVPCLLGFALAAIGFHAGSAGAALRPTGDVVERFVADPRGNASWFASGGWSWDRATTTLASAGVGAGTLLWNPGSHFTGTLALRLRLLEAHRDAEPRARLIFAHDAVRGAHRWLEIAAGNPGRLTLRVA